MYMRYVQNKQKIAWLFALVLRLRPKSFDHPDYYPPYTYNRDGDADNGDAGNDLFGKWIGQLQK